MNFARPPGMQIEIGCWMVETFCDDCIVPV